MTVRVIRPAVREIACQHCGSVLEYNPSDVQSTYDYDYRNGVEFVQYIECPECNKHVKLTH